MPQLDPGSDGNGTHEHPPPYDRAPEAEQRRPGVAPGSVWPEAATEESQGALYTSKVFEGWNFRYWLYLPPGLDPAKPSALFVAQDGKLCLTRNFRGDIVFDNLIAAGEMPKTIGLFIDPGGPTPDGSFEDHHRSEAYDTLSDRYVRFLVDEIIPDVVQSKYRLVDEPEGWCVGGFSSGGIAALTAAWFRPNTFRKVYTINGSFTPLAQKKTGKSVGGDSFPSMIREAEKKPLRITLLSGTKDITGELGNWMEANDEVSKALAEKGYAHRYLRGEGHHWIGEVGPDQGSADFPNALRWLWRGYRLP
jgi:enterochelin esterase-like enzyme